MNEVAINELDFDNRKEVRKTAQVMGKAFRTPPWNSTRSNNQAQKIVNSWRRLKRTHGAKVVVAEVNGQVVAAAVGHVVLEENKRGVKAKLGKGRHYYIREIAVHPFHVGRSIGPKLMHKLLAHARLEHCATAYAKTHAENYPMLKVFARNGFELFHSEPFKDGKWVYYKKQLARRK